MMLLCRWSITPHREGQHRPLVAAQLIKQRQNAVLKVGGVGGGVTGEGVWLRVRMRGGSWGVGEGECEGRELGCR